LSRMLREHPGSSNRYKIIYSNVAEKRRCVAGIGHIALI
jgi:hypothetical protein